jgi:hypothetical protein
MKRYFGSGPLLGMFMLWASRLFFFTALSACAATPQLVDHAFTFDVISDSPDIELLDYRYGDSKFPAARNPENMRAIGTAPQRVNIRGEMRKGDSLYVKWRVKTTAQVYEETVDLRHRLPADITGYRVYFTLNSSRLYIYLISPERRPPEMPPNGPRAYRHLKIVTLYPDQSRP